MATVDATKLEEKHQHEKFGFVNLHYSVSEASGSVKLQVRNKKKASGEEEKIGVRTQLVNEGAKIGKDFEEIDYVIDFSTGTTQIVEVKIFDDEQWEPDRDFQVVLYDPKTGVNLPQKDTKATVTIIDDDKPGFLSFAEKRKDIKHVATDKECKIIVDRTNGSDGRITCQYETFTPERLNQGRAAEPGVDYEHVAGELVFEHNVCKQEIVVPIL